MEKLNLTLSLVGAGAMGGAIALGLVESGAVDPSAIVAYDAFAPQLERLADKGIRTAGSLEELLAQECDVVLLAVKPQVLPQLLEQAAAPLRERAVISIAAGIKTTTIEAALPGARVVRVMPNLPIQVLSGASAICAGTSATPADVECAQAIFSALGSAQVMTEAQLDVAGAISGCGPAFFALFADTLTRVGVRAGLPAAGCREMVLATMGGVAQQLLGSGEHPRVYMERVTSPGGTTAAALEAMEPYVQEASIEAVDAALERTRQLAGDA